MQAAASRRSSTRTSGVVAGSVWETRMKLDQVKGGIKVFNGEESRDVDDAGGGGGGGDDEAGLRDYNLRLRRHLSDVAADKRKRKNWSPPEAPAAAVGGVAAAEKSPPSRLRKTQSSSSSNSPKISDKTFVEVGEVKAVARSLSNAGDFDGRDGDLVDQDCGGRGDVEEIEIEAGRKSFDDKDVDMSGEKKPGNAEEEKIDQIRDIPISSDAEEKMPEAMDESPPVDPDVVSASSPKIVDVVVPPPPPRAVDPEPAKPPPKVIGLDLTAPTRRAVHREVMEPDPVAEEELYEGFPETQHRMQSMVDLVMWRDTSRSAFVFGIGSFLLLSSSYTKDLNFSLISTISYMGLVYLAAIFLYKSIIRRGVVDFDETSEGGMVGEEEAIWMVRLLLPYINELLLKLKALFSGDPTTTMKLAVMLFVLARCGGAITFWTMAKLAFFGVFTIPKICSSYSVQLARYGKFWLERVRDAWDSCQHKKAVAAAVFTLIWNLSSTVARVWAVFMLVVAVRFYQQRLVDGNEAVEEDETWDGQEEAAEVQRPQQQPQRWLQGAAEDSKQRADAGVGAGGRGRVTGGAAGGKVAGPQLGPGRGHRHTTGTGQTRVVRREKKKWS